MSAGSFTERGAPSSSSTPSGPDGSGLGGTLPPPTLVPNPGRAAHPSPPADLPFLPAFVGIPCAARVCPFPADPAPPG